MSTFAVFGMTESYALDEARKRTSTSKGKIPLTPAEWEEAVARRAAKTMEGVRCVQLSNLFDAPQFAQEYIELLGKHGASRNLRIRARVKVTPEEAAKKGRRKKRTSLEWIDMP